MVTEGLSCDVLGLPYCSVIFPAVISTAGLFAVAYKLHRCLQIRINLLILRCHFGSLAIFVVYLTTHKRQQYKYLQFVAYHLDFSLLLIHAVIL